MQIEHSLSRKTHTVELGVTGLLDLMSFTFPTDDPQEKEARNLCINAETERRLVEKLSLEEAKVFTYARSDPDAQIEPKEEARLWDKYDDVLVEMAASVGWRMYESHVVLSRIARWSEYDWRGNKKLKRFNEAINRYAGVARGLARLPFTEQGWYQTRKNAIQEIKALQKKLSAQFAIRNRRPDPAEIYVAIRTEIAAKTLAYRYLTSNLASFTDYLEQHSKCAISLATNQITPANLVNGWFDYQGSTADGKSRQIISRIGGQKRQ